MRPSSSCRRRFVRGSLSASALLWLPEGLGCASSGGDAGGAVVVPEWQEVADGLQASNQCCYTRDSPPDDPAQGGPENHAPLIALRDDGRAEITLGAAHPMTTEHWITTMYARDQDGVVIGFRDFGATAIKPQFTRGYQPSLEFALPAGTSSVRAFSYCNLHSHWAGDRTNV